MPAVDQFSTPKFALIIPTFNAAEQWPALLQGILNQSLKPDSILVIDSSSPDRTAELARTAGFHLVTIPQSEFNHGRTRQLALQYVPHAEILVYLTQDAVLAGAEAFTNLLAGFADPRVALAYGRQLPRLQAGPVEAHARLFNYPERSQLRTFADRQTLGFKTIFCSNSFAAYRRSVLEEVGGFPGHVILGEDTVTAARILQKGYSIAYVASACAYHSHNYTLIQEFRRYFDTGVLHSRESWLRQTFGSAGNEGMRFVRSELGHLARRAPWLLPVAPLRIAAKWIGYRLGRFERYLPRHLKRSISMHRAFWESV